MELSSLPNLGARRFAEHYAEPKCQDKKCQDKTTLTRTSITKTTLAKTWALAAALLSSAAVFANTDVTFNVTASSPSFTLSTASLGPAGCGIRAGIHRYDSVTFRVNSSGNHNVSTLSLTGMNNDNFIAVYSGVFNPQTPTANVIGCNDDRNTPTDLLAEFSTNMITGNVYTGVVTSFNAYSGTNQNGSGSYRISPAVTLVYTLSGTVSGLGAGKSAKIRVNGGTETTISANGSFTSTTALDANTAYTVTVSQQPVGQQCTLTNATGTIGTANVTNIGISCANLPTYTLTYDTQGGSAVASQTDIGGSTITLAAAPTLANYTFTGWNTNSAGTGTNYSAGASFVMPSSATTLYAIWTANTVTLTFDANGGTSVSSITGNIGSALTAPTSPIRVGYSFTGWSPTLPSTLPATNTTYTAQWQINNYSLSFNSNGGSSVNTISGAFGSAVTAPAAPTRSGYTFTGWTPALPTTVPAANTSYTAQWQINNYSLSFDSNGGTSVSPITADFGTNVTAPAAPTRTGYTFSGWSPALPTTVPAANTSYTAQWQINSFSLSFDSNGGSSVSPITADFGTNVTAPAAPTRTGYTFTGWSPALPTTVPAANTSYTAQWQINSYSLTFDSNGGSSVSPINANFGSTVTAPAAPTRSGYTFTGWSPALPTTVPAANTSYTAQWQINSYSLTFDSNGGSSVSPINANFGTNVTAPAAPTRSGYTFSGWNPALPSTVPAANTSYTAQWQINSYSLTFDSNGGTSVSPITADFGTNVTAPAAPTRTGYTFSGWSPALPTTVPAANTSYTAQWQINSYSLSFDSNGGSSVSPINANFGSTVTTPAAPTRSGYTFTGWSPALPTTVPAANTSYTAQWQINSYSLSFDSNGGSSVSPINANFGTNVTAPAAPTRTGYTFSGWSPALPTTVPATNTSYTAQWQINSYSLSFDSNGGSSVSPITADFGTNVTAPAAPTRTGYTFSGWNPALPSTVPAANTSYTAQWQINRYDVTVAVEGKASVNPTMVTVDHGQSARIAITAGSDQYLTVASNCQASVQGRELFVPPLTAACQVRLTAFDSVVADAQNTTAATVNEARTLRLRGGAGDKAMQAAAVLRAGQREVLTNEQATAVLVKQADGSYRFSATRTGRYSFDFVDAVSGERVSVNFDVLPYVAFSSSQQPGKLATASQIGVFLSDDAIEYPVTVSVDALGVDGVPAVFEIQASDERRKDYRFTPVAAEQNKLSLQANLVQNAIVGTPAVHQIVMQTTVLPITLNAMTSQNDTETLVVKKQAGAVKVLTQTSSVGNFTYEFSAQGISFATQAGVTTFDPSLLAVGRYNIKVSATSDDGRVGTTELSVRVIDSCPLASCDAISAVGIPTQVNPQAAFEERLPLCPQQAQGNRVQSCESKQSDFIEAPAGYLLGLGRVADSQSWTTGQFGSALTDNSVPDAGYTQRGYRVNFDVQGLENPGEAVPVVIPLPDGVVIPSNALWRKLIAGKWQNFVSNSANRIDSAMRDSQALCPTVASNVWQAGLIPGMQCVRLTIQDGGPNDDDQAANNVIRDPGVLATVNQYTLSFDSAGGSSVAAIKQDFGSVITPPKAPTRTGFTFTGWSEAVPDTMPAMDKTLVAQWQRNNYVITFDSAGGSSVNSITVAFDNPVTLPAAPTRQGYTFAGWNPAVPSKMPASNLTVTATWTISQYDTRSNGGALGFWSGIAGVLLLLSRRYGVQWGRFITEKCTSYAATTIDARQAHLVSPNGQSPRVRAGIVALLLAYGGAAQANDTYVGMQWGNADTDVTAAEIERGLQAAGFSGKAELRNDTRMAYRFYAGKNLGYGVAAELAWVDLADVQTRFIQLPRNIAPQDLRRLMAESGSGLEVSLLYSFAFNADITPTFRLGAMQMNSRYRLNNPEYTYLFKDHDVRLVAAVGVRYSLSERWNLQLNYSHFDSRPYSTSFINAGVEYRF